MQQQQLTVLPMKFQARVPVVATLKIGEVEQVGGKARPKKIDRMRICSASATAAGIYADHKDYTEFNKSRAQAVTIELVSDDPRVNLDIVYAMAGRGAILCRGNGKEAERRTDPRGSISADVPFKKLPDETCGEECAFFRNGTCKLASTLRFRIPADTKEGTIPTALGSIVQFRTSSWNTAQDLLGAMESIKALTGGVLARISLKLYMTEQNRKAITSNGRQSTNFWTLGLSFPGDEADLVVAVGKALKLRADMAALSIPTLETLLQAQGSDLLDPDLPAGEQLAIAAEYFPHLPTKLPPGGEGVGEASLEAQPQGAAQDIPATTEGQAADAEVPAPKAEGEAKPPQDDGVRPSQRSMILRYASRVSGVDEKALLAIIDKRPDKGGWTQERTRTFINKELIVNTEKAFLDLGVVKMKATG